MNNATLGRLVDRHQCRIVRTCALVAGMLLMLDGVSHFWAIGIGREDEAIVRLSRGGATVFITGGWTSGGRLANGWMERAHYSSEYILLPRAGYLVTCGERDGYWIAFPFLLPAIIAIVMAVLVRFRNVRRSDGLCDSCGYDLTGNVSGRCSECGVET